MLSALFAELLCKTLALLFVVYTFHTISTEYLEAVVEATRAYITVVDILYTRERLPLRV